MNKSINLFNKWSKVPVLPDYLKQDLLQSLDNELEIEERFYQHLSFGTGGMRGLLGAGTNRINIYTIRRVAEGVALFIKQRGSTAMQQGIVIAFDTRNFSKEFALECAKTIGKYGIKVYLFSESRPTPELSFAIRHLNTYAGIVITASHNPAEYNGIKVYGEDGGQLAINPTNAIVHYIDSINDLFSIGTGNENELIANGILTYVLDEIDVAYLEQLLTLRENIPVLTRYADNLSIVYTPLHGAGLIPVKRGLQSFGFTQVTIVEEQAIQDPRFPTVKYPNPEEKEAFELAIKVGLTKNADLLLATDPDADRLGVAVLNKSNQYELLSGNQLGALLLHYILSQKMKKDELPLNGVVLKTIVTSELGRTISSKFGVQTIDTLTGFKFISEKVEEFNKSGKYKFLFGYEESYGYLISDFARDKDAVQAALLTAEMAVYYQSIGKSLLDALQDLYEEFGYYKEALQSITAEGKGGQAKISQIMTYFRENTPSNIGGINVIAVEDYMIGTRRFLNGIEELLILPKENVIKVLLEDNCWVCIRPSGTEPKCKFYFGVKSDTAEGAENVLFNIKDEFIKLVNKLC